MADINKPLGIMDKWLKEVSINNDHEIKRTKRLRTLLFTLQIVGHALPGIKPIVKDLETIIDELRDSTTILVNEGREELKAAFEEIKKYIEEKEGK